MGHAILPAPEDCKLEEAFTNEYWFKTKTCLLEEGPQQRVYVTYLDEEIFPGASGQFLEAYSLLTRALADDSTKRKAYLSEFQDRYGSFDGRPGQVLLCRPGTSDCAPLAPTYDPETTFNSSAYQMFVALTGRSGARFVRVAVLNSDLVARIEKVAKTNAAQNARALVR